MNKTSNRLRLTGSEFVVRGATGQNRQIASARWQFIQAVGRVVPVFLKRLRETVYPAYAQLADGRLDYWQPGWKIATWRLHSDADNQLTPLLLEWARAFNVEREDWILEGSLQTLSDWHRWPLSRDVLECGAFGSTLPRRGSSRKPSITSSLRTGVGIPVSVVARGGSRT
jgi:hypothetical protein